ncbi:MAG TPA: nucleoside monophosphate kinase [Candidatus Paceibacterota bacterium]
MDLKTFIFMGRSGCGKGTQAKLLIDELKKRDPVREVTYLESGEGFRELLAQDTHTSLLAKDIMDRGALQPAFLAIHIWSHLFIKNMKGDEHMVIDGTPRKLNEARIFADALRFYKRPEPAVLHVNVSRAWSRERLLSRGRGDDKSANIEGRLDWFDSAVVPAIEYFRDEADMRVIDINGEQSIEDVKAEILGKVF